jgi:hypothetical protein
MIVTVQALSSPPSVSTGTRSGRSFLRRFVESLIAGRQHKAEIVIAEYLGRHPEYLDLSRESD